MIAAVLVGGCSPAVRDRPSAGAAVKAPPKESRGFLSEQGEATQRSADDRRVIWIVRWRAAAVSVEGDAASTGRLKNVSGTVFQEGKAICDFEADEGDADGATETLTLTRNVRVVHKESKATLTCDELVYRGKAERFTARSNVVLETDRYRVGPLDAMWANADLTQGGTPNEKEP
ncbi:MAG: LPS export ABC transporter periplasmic protein LptC [Fimbriimonadaceae bacterium]|nr:LPS export ABC transporter periplasmic protein LptC [Fimbriimonadaceae bacterium]